jgi:hypothetical protein
MPKFANDELVAGWNDQDLMEAWLMTPSDAVLSPLDHAIAAEFNRRTSDNPIKAGSQRERLLSHW